MKYFTYLITGLVCGLIMMYAMYPMINPPQRIKIVKEIQYETKWKVKKEEITFTQAKKCVFEPIIITSETQENKILVTASDGCKEAQKEMEIKQEESFWKKAAIGTGMFALGILTGIIL